MNVDSRMFQWHAMHAIYASYHMPQATCHMHAPRRAARRAESLSISAVFTLYLSDLIRPPPHETAGCNQTAALLWV